MKCWSWLMWYWLLSRSPPWEPWAAVVPAPCPLSMLLERCCFSAVCTNYLVISTSPPPAPALNFTCWMSASCIPPDLNLASHQGCFRIQILPWFQVMIRCRRLKLHRESRLGVAEGLAGSGPWKRGGQGPESLAVGKALGLQPWGAWSEMPWETAWS